MSVSHCGCTDPLVVLVLHGSNGQVFILAHLGDHFQDLFILFKISTTPHNQRYVNTVADLFDYLGGILGASVFAVGIDALELEDDQFRPVLVDTFFCPGHRVGHYILERTDSGFGPVLGLHVPHLHGNFGFVRHFAFKLIKRITRFASDGDRFIPITDGDLFYAAGISFFIEFESQCNLL